MKKSLNETQNLGTHPGDPRIDSNFRLFLDFVNHHNTRPFQR